MMYAIQSPSLRDLYAHTVLVSLGCTLNLMSPRERRLSSAHFAQEFDLPVVDLASVADNG